MAQFPVGDFGINPSVVSGTDLATILNSFQQGVLTVQAGGTSPPVFADGTLWLDTATPTNYELKIYSGAAAVWVAFLQYDSTTGVVGVPPGSSVPVTTVNTRLGDVKIKEIYESTGTSLIADATTNGLDVVINQDADPTTNLTATTGRIAFDSTELEFVGFDGTSWSSLGGGKWYLFSDTAITDGGTIALENKGQQLWTVGATAPITLNVLPFGATPPDDGTVIRLRGNSDVNTVTIVNNITTNGCKLFGDYTLKADYILELMYFSDVGMYVEISRNS